MSSNGKRWLGGDGKLSKVRDSAARKKDSPAGALSGRARH